MAETLTVSPRMPGPPQIALPRGACDCHTHVFGPFDRFSMVNPAAFAMPLAPAALHRRMLDQAGLDHAVLVQPAHYAEDHSALLDALDEGAGRFRGIGLAAASATDAVLDRLHERGVRGLRFTEMRNPDGSHRAGSIGMDQLFRLADRLRERGWQAHLWAPLEVLDDHAPALASLGLPIVVDHFCMLRPEAGAADPAFVRLADHVRAGTLWVKLSVCRVSTQAPDYPDLRPFHDVLVEANSRQLLWASDWPFIRLDPQPDVGALLNLEQGWSRDPALRQSILVDNPARLFGF